MFRRKRCLSRIQQKRSVHWGLQDEPVVKGTLDFVAPSSSGLVRMNFNEITEIYSELTRLLEQFK